MPMLPFALPTDHITLTPPTRPDDGVGHALRMMVDVYVGLPQRTDTQQQAFKDAMLAAIPAADAASLFAVATKLCPCPDVDFTIASALMVHSQDAALMLHAEAVFLHENYLIVTARRGASTLAAAIALRSELSHSVLAALVQRDEPLIDIALADNHGLLLPREVRRVLQARGRFDTDIAAALLRRRDIQPLERLPLFLRGDTQARAKLIAECAPLLAPALRPAYADRPLPLRLAAFEEASHGRYGPLAEFLGLDPAFLEAFCRDPSGEPLALLCAAAELRGFDTLAVLAHWPTQPARQAGRLSALSDIATGLLPGIALALLLRIG